MDFNKTTKTVKETGCIYTPKYIVNNILDLSEYYGTKILKKHVIDNSCGDGAFLCEIVKRYCEVAKSNNISLSELRYDLSTYIHGIEINPRECDKCISNVTQIALVYGVTDVDWDIICENALSVTKFDGMMDYVLGNPPYVRVHNLNEIFSQTKSFSFAKNGMTDLYLVFYEIGIRMLTKNGTLGYITPSSFFNSLAGTQMRKEIVNNHLLRKIVDLKHYQAFEATTYTTIVILQQNNQQNLVDYYQFDEKNKIPYFVDSLSISDYYIGGNFYFAAKENLELLKKINTNLGESDISVKNGYATLCDDVFVGDFDFDSPYIIPVVKSSKGIIKKIIFPYDRNSKLLDETDIQKDEKVYQHLLANKSKLVKRSNEKDAEIYWYAFGRSQAINDTFREKVAINALVRDENDFKFVKAPAGVGVYGGLYIVSNSISAEEIETAIKSKEFITYISLLGKYKSGGYYTFSSKDVKTYLDYKFAYEGGLFAC